MAASDQVLTTVQSAKEMTETNTTATDLGVTKDSEEVFEMYCEPCNREGTIVTATAFCPSCVDHLCATCLKFHKRFLPDHECSDNEKMSRDICLEKCSIHRNEIIKFYCATCKKCACSVCKKKNHNVSVSCKLNYFSDLVTDVEIGSGLKDLISKGDNIVKTASKTEEIIKEIHEGISDIPRNAQTALKNDIETMFSSFFKEMQNIEEKIQVEKKLDEGRIEAVTEKYKSLKVDIDKLSDTHKQSPESASNEKYAHFIKLKTFDLELEKMAVSLQGVSKQCPLSGDELKSSVKIQVNKLTERFKTISTAVRQFGTENKRTNEKIQKKVANEVAVINVGTAEDEQDCWISKCFLLSDHILFVCDTSNYSVKLFNVRTQYLLCNKPVNSPPRAATKVTKKEIAIVQNYAHLRGGSSIQFLTLTKSNELFFQKKRRIQTNMECRDLIYNQDRLIIALQGRNECKVQIMDMDGDVLETIESDENGDPLFVSPDYIAIHPNAEQLYVSDWSTGNITEVKLDSQEQNRVVKQFWNPHGLTSDSEGFIYVVEDGTFHTKVIHPDHPDHSNVQRLLENDQRPHSLHFCNKENKLYVGMAGNCVKVYKITDSEYIKCEALETVKKWLPA